MEKQWLLFKVSKGVCCETHSLIFKQTNNMEKYRIAFTVQDYYDYVGTSPYYSTKERMLKSIPKEFEWNGYNIKFKCIHNKIYPWYKYYRVHMSVIMPEEEIKRVLDQYKDASLKFNNISYKLITKHF